MKPAVFGFKVSSLSSALGFFLILNSNLQPFAYNHCVHTWSVLICLLDGIVHHWQPVYNFIYFFFSLGLLVNIGEIRSDIQFFFTVCSITLNKLFI